MCCLATFYIRMTLDQFKRKNIIVINILNKSKNNYTNTKIVLQKQINIIIHSTYPYLNLKSVPFSTFT